MTITFPLKDEEAVTLKSYLSVKVSFMQVPYRIFASGEIGD